MIEMDVPPDALAAGQAYWNEHKDDDATDLVNGIIQSAIPHIVAVAMLCFANLAECPADMAKGIRLYAELSHVIPKVNPL